MRGLGTWVGCCATSVFMVAVSTSGCSGGGSGTNPEGTGDSGGSGSTAANSASNSGSSGTSSGGGAGTSATNAISTTGTGGSAVAGPCDPTSVPLEAGCISGEHAVFVWEPGAANGPVQGDDGFEGTKTRPVATLTRAVQIAVEQGKGLVIACGPSLLSGLNASDVSQDIRIVGGHTCPDEGGTEWSPADRRTVLDLETISVVAPYTGHATVEVRNSPGQITIENFSFNHAPELRDPPYGVQRIGAIFEASNVVLQNVAIAVEAGDTDVALWFDEWIYPDDGDLEGSTNEGDEGCVIACDDGSLSFGGQGELLSPATPAEPGLPDLGGGAPGNRTTTSSSCDADGTHGGQGANGADGEAGEGAGTHGYISQGVFLGTPGATGQHGKVGQGGGGGGSMADTDGVPGACGGCPGHGGGAGLAGGSSIAILSIDSTLRIAASELVVGNGAPGGAGHDGQAGQAGGISHYFETECAGGDGGNGGSGGPGGGGAGGLSVGVLFTGAAPELVDTDVSVGLPGLGGAGPAGNDGIEGVSAETYELVPEGEHCVGSSEGCDDVDSIESCALVPGCSPVLVCRSWCHTAKDADTCATLSGCAWDEDACGNFGNDCVDFEDEETCGADPGCVWGVCDGLGVRCEALTGDACSLTPGCSLE